MRSESPTHPPSPASPLSSLSPSSRGGTPRPAGARRGQVRRAGRLAVLGAAGVAFLGGAALLPPAPAAAAGVAAKSRPFAVGGDGYTCFRIPSIITTRSGALLAFAEGRVDTCDDIGHNDIVVKKSVDGGRTWGALTVVAGAAAGDDDAHGNPSPVVDAVTGRISVLYATSDWKLKENGTRDRGVRNLRAVSSVDEGAGWRDDRPLPHLKGDTWNWVSTGPGHGVQLTRGAHHGRLVVTGDHRDDLGTPLDASDDIGGGQLYYSDDGGLTWNLGARHATPIRSTTVTVTNPGELAVVERTDGSLYVNARSSAACGYNERRLAALSTDGGRSFTGLPDPSAPGSVLAPFGRVPVSDLDAPPVFGSLIRLPPKDLGGTQDRILFSAPSRSGGSVSDRQQLAIRSSDDEGANWSASGLLVGPDRAGYSDMSLIGADSVALVYETAVNTSHGNIDFTTFSPSQVTGATTQVRLPRTSDPVGAYRDDAAVHGGAALTPRGSGTAIALDGQDDHLRLSSCSPDLDLSAGDFTVTAHFRHTESDGAQPIFWAYGNGTGAQQVFLKAERDAARGTEALRGVVSGSGGYTEARLDSSYRDGQWHHVALVREGESLRLTVDGATTAIASGGTGDVSPDGPYDIHLGTRPDRLEHFSGAIDDVRVYNKALDPTQISNVRGGSLTESEANARLRLGFTTLW
ncbi:sialidase [Streptomyces sp. t39]|nr:sialidase [Streptomyces sp. t39]